MFLFKKSNTKPEVPILKTLPSKASTTYKEGDALVLSGGVLDKATGTKKPEYICTCNYVAPATGMEPIAVQLITPCMEFETTFAVDASAVAVGSSVTIHTDAAQVTATTANGVAKVLRKHGTGATGTAVTVTF